MYTMKNQRGVALFISLVLLLVLTIIGVSAVQTTSMEERMARNTHDSVLAFEAAEVALRTGETFLRNNVNSTALFPPFDPVSAAFDARIFALTWTAWRSRPIAA